MTPIQIVLLLLSLFLLGSMIGYLIEVLFRRFFSAKKWVNPGFMKGPWLPLYGFGVVTMFAFSLAFEFALPSSMRLYNPKDALGLGYESGATVYDLLPILVMGCGMILLEFLAGLLFIKGFKVKLWDYSNQKGNIMGIICPLFSVIWFALSIVYYYGIHPFMVKAVSLSYAFLFGENGEVANVGVLFLFGMVYGIMLVDFVTSTGMLRKISAKAKESKTLRRFEEWKEEFEESKRKAKERFLERVPVSAYTEKVQERKDLAKQKLNEILLIDPNQAKPDNYDENGRPISEKED